MKSDKTHLAPSPSGPAFTEKPEPTARRTPMPIALIVLFGFLLFWGGMYVDRFGGQLNPDVYAPYISMKQLEGLQPGGDDPGIKRGRTLYLAACAPCHQATGLGTPGTIPPLAGSEWVLGAGPARMIRIIENGLTGPVTVKGANFANQMPPMVGAVGGEAEVTDLINFIRSNREWGHKAPKVKIEEVKAVRDQIKDRGTQWTAPELLDIPEEVPVK